MYINFRLQRVREFYVSNITVSWLVILLTRATSPPVMEVQVKSQASLVGSVLNRMEIGQVFLRV
jgi:hypothetical protein